MVFWQSGLLVIQSSGLLAFWPSGLLAIRPSDHPAFWSSRYLVIQTSSHLIIQPSGHPVIWSSDHSIFWPYGLLAIRSSGLLAILASGLLSQCLKNDLIGIFLAYLIVGYTNLKFLMSSLPFLMGRKVPHAALNPSTNCYINKCFCLGNFYAFRLSYRVVEINIGIYIYPNSSLRKLDFG